MPNWCSNRLRVYPTDQSEEAIQQLSDFVQAAEGVYPPEGAWPEQSTPDDSPSKYEILCFHAIVPLPLEVFLRRYDPDGFNAEKRLWGCKWGACDPIVRNWKPGETQADYTFLTPWVPPVVWICAASKAWPGLAFDLRYEDEPDIAIFGRAVAFNGKVVKRIDWKPMGGHPLFRDL